MSVKVFYRNYRGEVSLRHIEQREAFLETVDSEYHGKDAPILKAWDIDKGAFRDFCLHDFLAPGEVKVRAKDLEMVVKMARTASSVFPDDYEDALRRLKDIVAVDVRANNVEQEIVQTVETFVTYEPRNVSYEVSVTPRRRSDDGENPGSDCRQ